MGNSEIPTVEVAAAARIRISRYGTRQWAVWFDEQLLVVAAYKKGAHAVAATLARLLAPHSLP